MDHSELEQLTATLLVIEEALSASFGADVCEEALEQVSSLGVLATFGPGEKLLADVRRELERRAGAGDRDPTLIQLEAPKGLGTRLQQVRQALGGPRFVYHGTTAGRLGAIAKEGLVPGKPAVWGGAGLATHRFNALFFCDDLVSAIRWAEVAQSRGRGRKDAVSRRPIVIRLNASGLALEPDQRGVIGSCHLVRTAVPVDSAVVRLGKDTSLDGWVNIDDMINRLELR